MKEVIIEMPDELIGKIEESKSDEILQEIYTYILEELNTRLLSKEEKKLLRRPSVRRELLQRCGKEAFLIPDKLKFPIVSPLSKNCKPDCRLLYAAYLRANEWKKKNPEYAKIAETAKKLYMKNKCDLKIKIKIHEQIVDLEEYLMLLGE